jgi:hypothetical protein
MKRSNKAPVPGLTLFFLGVPFILAVLVLYYLNPGYDWLPHLRIPHFAERTDQSAETMRKAKVWVNKSTGVYYCPDSEMYGHSALGSYMAQGDAIQTGYSPALGKPCQ